MDTKVCSQCHNGMLLRATIEYVALAGLHQYAVYGTIVCARGSTTKCLGKLCLSIGVCEDIKNCRSMHNK